MGETKMMLMMLFGSDDGKEVACIDCDAIVKEKRATKYGKGWRCRLCSDKRDAKLGLKQESQTKKFKQIVDDLF